MRYELTTVKVSLKVEETAPMEEVNDQKKAAQILRAIFAQLDTDQEHFIILVLDTRFQVRGYKVIASGGCDATIVDPRVLFRAALLMGAGQIILSHNHPSGDPNPSHEDMEMTRRMVEAGKMIGIQVADHVIIGQGTLRHYSFLEHGAI